MSGSLLRISNKKAGLTLAEVLLAASMFLILMSAIFSLLTQSVRLLEPSGEDKMSEVLLLASKIRADVSASETVEVVGQELILTGTFEEQPFTLVYSPTTDGLGRTSNLAAMGSPQQEFFIEDTEFEFSMGDAVNNGEATEVVSNILVLRFQVKFSERTRDLVVKVVVPSA